MSSAPLLLPDLDTVAVERFCRVVDERAARQRRNEPRRSARGTHS